MAMFVSIPMRVEAEQFTMDSKDRVYHWAVQIQGNVTPSWEGHAFESNPCLLIPTLEGVMKCSIGDYLVREPHPTEDRRLYPVKPEIFRSRYKQVGDAG